MQHNTTHSVIGHEFLSLLPDDQIVNVVRKSIPIFVGSRNSKGGLTFKCPACNRQHHHKAGSGLRTPNCFVKPPVFTSGYYVLEPLNADGVVPVEYIKRTKVEAFLKGLNGKVFGVDFIKKNGQFRRLTGRLDVVAPLKGGENKVEVLDRPYITVFEIQTKGYRNVNLDTIKRVRANNSVYDVID